VSGAGRHRRRTVAEARAAAETIGANSGGVVVVKAQVKVGGRGKAGGVKVAKSAQEAAEAASQILGMDIKGHTVHQVMIAAGAQIDEEYYFSVLLDRANRTYLAMASKEGGMEIEVLAVERPEALARVAVDPIVGIDAPRPSEIVGRRRLTTTVKDAARPAEAVDRLPRARTRRWSRSTRWSRPQTAGSSPSTARSRWTRTPASVTRARGARGQGLGRPARGGAKAKDLNYVKLDGSVGIIGNGAGLVMSTLDVVAYAGEEFAAGASRRTSSTSAAAPRPRSWPRAAHHPRRRR
jgi:succinyl-CoA synthetase beta subunit